MVCQQEGNSWMIAIGKVVRGKILGLTIASAAAFVLATLGLAAGPQNAAKPGDDAASIFKSRCAMCHGDDGSGTTLGKGMQVPDLRSAKVQRQPSSALSQVVREGKNNMPSFERSLDSAQIEGLVGFMRRLDGKTPAGAKSTSVAEAARVKRNPAQEQRDWAVWGGASENNHYSALTQINRTSVKQLAVAWSFDSQEEGGLQTSPIVAEGVLYGITPTQKIFALDATTGKLFWKFDSGVRGTQPDRGLAYWTDGNGKDTRILVGVMNFVYALDAITGQPISSFGDQGRID